MRVRHRSDLRTIVWTLLGAGVVALQYANPHWVPYLWWLSCYFALASGVIAHNHNHHATFVGKKTNACFSVWLSLFYGYPTFAWIPTHNLNHHRYVNRHGDATITWRVTNRHHLGMALTYFFVSAYWQGFLIRDFIANARANNRRLYRFIVAQYSVCGAVYVSLLVLAVTLHGLRMGVMVWLCSVAVPAVFALWTIMLFNYDQHAHADPFSRWAHSRSFTSPVLNFLLFNNGYHFAHHENPRVHWRQLKRVHAELASRIDPRLNEPSLAWYWFRQYCLAPIWPRLGTQQIGPGPMNPPGVKTSLPIGNNKPGTESQDGGGLESPVGPQRSVGAVGVAAR